MIHLEMFPRLRKQLPVVISWILILLSTIGMFRFKSLGEISRAEIHETGFFICKFISILALCYLVLNWLFGLWKQYRQLKNDKNEAELMLLKSKIDPHFFFNTLNNLYGLAIEKSDDTPKVILKLSEIMRYTIYEGENDRVALKDEVSYLEQYIEIHKIRYKKTVDISFNKAIDNEEMSIAPLLFIMLLENAFKHGVGSLTNNAFINIYLTAMDGVITFIIENNFEPKERMDKGMGLDNLKKRLQLIYPKKHKLNIASDGMIYKANLTIEL